MKSRKIYLISKRLHLFTGKRNSKICRDYPQYVQEKDCEIRTFMHVSDVLTNAQSTTRKTHVVWYEFNF